jgi:pimeloyl-ACP methyl ester carboxylesterase
MTDLRKYGRAPFGVALLHGGPATPGEMAPVAREISADWGVLEPMQKATSVEGQVEELHGVLNEHADLPVILIGFSWGAWLGFMLAARHPAFVRKLILVGSGPFETQYAVGILETRLRRLSDEERRQVRLLMEALNDRSIADKDASLARLGGLFTKADAYDPLTLDTEVLQCQYDIHRSVWTQAEELRASGKLLELGRQIRCPVVAIHGDYDPHPAEGVRKPLTAVLEDFRFVLLERCGHCPWIERQARHRFYEILESELRCQSSSFQRNGCIAG